MLANGPSFNPRQFVLGLRDSPSTQNLTFCDLKKNHTGGKSMWEGVQNEHCFVPHWISNPTAFLINNLSPTFRKEISIVSFPRLAEVAIGPDHWLLG